MTDQRRAESPDNRLLNQPNPAQRSTLRVDRRAGSNSNKSILRPEASAESRDRLLAELNDLGSGDDAAIWAHRSLVEKNRLTTADAQCVEEAFQARLTTFATPAADPPETSEKTKPLPAQYGPDSQDPKKRSRSKRIDKSVLALQEPRRARDRDHVRYVAHQSCLICGRRPSDAHHLRFAQSRALSCKVSE
jgi:hypothetical protein